MRIIGAVHRRSGRAVFVPETRRRDVAPRRMLYGRQVRIAARAIVADNQGRIALIRSSRGRYHKLPGGGVETGERLLVALRREAQEEIGARVAIEGELGAIIQYDEASHPYQVSFGYACTLVGELGEQALTKKEIRERFVVKWVEPAAAARALQREWRTGMSGADSVRLRELAYIEAWREFRRRRAR